MQKIQVQWRLVQDDDRVLQLKKFECKEWLSCASSSASRGSMPSGRLADTEAQPHTTWLRTAPTWLSMSSSSASRSSMPSVMYLITVCWLVQSSKRMA